MFLAIVNDTYAEVKGETIEDEDMFWIYLKEVCKKSKCCRKKGPGEEEEPRRDRHSRKEIRAANKLRELEKTSMGDFFKIVDQKDSEDFRKIAARVVAIEGSMERLHERLDALIAMIRQRI